MGKQKEKKKLPWWAELLICLGSMVLGYVLFHLFAVFLVWYSDLWGDRVDYDAYQKEFDLVAEYLWEQDFEGRTIFWVKYDEEGNYYLAFLEDSDTTYPVPDEVAEALRVLDTEAFDGHVSFDLIYVEEDWIEFTGETSHYSFIYSPDGRPKYPDRDGVHVKKEASDWYHVVY